MRNKYMQYLMSAVVILGLLIGCRSAPPPAPSTQLPVKSFKDFPDHFFNPREYIVGMVKGGHNILIWQDPSVNLRRYSSIRVADFDGRLLPVQHVFSYDPFISSFNATFQSSLRLPKKESSDGLRIEGMVVECNPGSRAARAWVGFGAGRVAGAVACEVYEPDNPRPIIRVYVRDTASGGTFGGDSVAMLNHIFFSVAQRLSTTLQARIGG
jgi:hypothetical protein